LVPDVLTPNSLADTAHSRDFLEEARVTTTIYYFSGTGNSLNVARMLSRELEDCDLIPMARLWKIERIIAPRGSVGFAFPMYFYGLPDIVERFVRKIELYQADYIFTVVTRGGAQGCSLQRIEDLLLEKTRHLNSGFYIDMPSNYILFHDVTTKDKHRKLFAHAEKKIQKIAKVIKAKRTKGEKDKLLLKKVALSSNRSFLDEVNARDEHFYADQNCISCGFCAKVCPVENILMVNGFPVWQHHCQHCLACMHFCPKESIQYKRKTIGRKRYHHPDVTFRDIESQNWQLTAKKIPAKKVPVKDWRNAPEQSEEEPAAT